MVGRGGHIVESQGSITLLPRGTLGSPVSPAMAEGASFYVGVFTVFAGLCLIVGMGFWSIYNPYKGEKFNRNNELSLILKSSSVQICPEHEEIANGVLDYGPGYNGTILEDTLLMFKCDEGKNI